MCRIIIILILGVIYSSILAQNHPVDSIRISSTISTFKVDTPESILEQNRNPSSCCKVFNHQNETFCKKMIRGSKYVAGFNLTMGGYLVVAPEHVSKWNKKEKFKIPSILHQYKESFTKPPVIDKDLWIVNYIGHPYQGGFYYNTVRSQGATFWQSSLFCIGQSVLWEYGWEAGMEQPSIQDLITTPFLGIVVGEISHIATVAMGKNGFRWYEKALACIINPSYAINNKLKVIHRQKNNQPIH